MGVLYDKLAKDVRFREGINSCINCGTCTAICAAAEFYNYDPRIIADTVQSRDESKIEALLKSETIWYCGECMSCKTRCPRGNAPGLIIMALRSLSQEEGYFVESEKGRQQLALKRTVGEWILKYGYCLYAENILPEMHPEQGPVWEWESKHLPEIFERLGGNYKGDGPGILRKIPQETLDELKSIFDVTGGTVRYEKIENFSKEKAKELGLQFDEGIDNEYVKHIYTVNNHSHTKE
ncbi:MAG: 4Fe-4S dicluster domain-containing protein [Lentimicrobiaceae bacterium]|jgi:heterodisulfide reductase subunit C|nr:4Fe-4S dicluster domain-containing protein [Lentimicrobiaceae bacterium]